jgi:hypothetical protein
VEFWIWIPYRNPGNTINDTAPSSPPYEDMVNVPSCISCATLAETPNADCIHDVPVCGNELAIKFIDTFA